VNACCVWLLTDGERGLVETLLAAAATAAAAAGKRGNLAAAVSHASMAVSYALIVAAATYSSYELVHWGLFVSSLTQGALPPSKKVSTSTRTHWHICTRVLSSERNGTHTHAHAHTHTHTQVILGGALLLALRPVVDYMLVPGRKVDDAIATLNWGHALVLGSGQLYIARIIASIGSADSCADFVYNAEYLLHDLS
jgi:hypothetical protein